MTKEQKEEFLIEFAVKFIVFVVVSIFAAVCVTLGYFIGTEFTTSLECIK